MTNTAIKGPFIITSSWAREAKDLVQAGDTNLVEQRARFKRIVGRDTALNDDQLTIATMAEDDGENDLQFIAGVIQIEQHGYTIVGSVAEPVE